MTKLKIRREAAGLTQMEMAQRIGISYRTYQSIEQGARNIDMMAAIKVYQMAKVLNCGIIDLLESVPPDVPQEATEP